MKYLVEYDDTTGYINDAVDFNLVVTTTCMPITPFKLPKSDSNNTDIDKLIKLKGAGFTAEEIVMLLATVDE